MRNTVLIVAVTCLVLLAFVPAQAVDTYWTNSSGGDWHTAANWDNGVPTSSDRAFITLAGTYSVNIDSNAVVFTIALGPNTADTVTLNINSQLEVWYLNARYHSTVNVIDILNQHGAFVLTEYSALNVYGTVYESDPGGIVQVQGCCATGRIYDGAVANLGGGLLAADGGVITIDDATVGYLRSYPGGMVHIRGDMSTNRFDVNYTGTVEVLPDASVYLLGGGGQGQNYLNIHGGTLKLYGGSYIHCVPNPARYPRVDLYVGGSLITLPDSANPNRPAIVDAELYGVAAGPTTVGANLEVTRVYLQDSLYIAAGCTLTVDSTVLATTARIGGSGTIHFRSRTHSLQGAWWFNGGFLLSSDPTAAIVNFNPNSSPQVTLQSLNMAAPTPIFTVHVSDTVTIDTISQGGGTINGNIVLGDAYSWTQGTLTAQSINEFTIPAGVGLAVTGGGSKTLDSLQLNIEGNAVMQGSGTFNLVDSAVVNVAPGGTLDVGDGFTMTGTGTLYNSGESNFDTQGDTISINVPVINSTLARTPGTIDILGRVTRLGMGGQNDAGINVADSADLIIAGVFNNNGVISVGDGAEIIVLDTLRNSAFGELSIAGGGSVGGGGVVHNGGFINSGGGSLLLSPTNSILSASLVNLQDSGFVTVVSDTLTISGDAVNRGVITIQAGAVLKILGTLLNDVTGLITGNGTLDVSDAISFTNNGTISPGLSPGVLSIYGSVLLGPQSNLLLEMAGPNSNQYDRLNITGNITLGGRLSFSMLGGYMPTPADSLSILNCGSWSGGFQQISGNDLGGGQLLDVALGPNGMSSGLCSGDAQISAQPALTDTVFLVFGQLDTITINVCNTGDCLLNYSLALSNLNPPSPDWISIHSLDQVGIVPRPSCRTIRMPVNTEGLSVGTHTAMLEVSSNDPITPLLSIPVLLNISLEPHLQVVLHRSSQPANSIRLNWRTIPGAESYTVHADSVADGSYFWTQTVSAPDTFLTIPINSNDMKRFFYVTVTITD